MSALRSHEQDNGASESTYWISFELLWREFFFWYAKRHGSKLFAFKGLSKQPPKTSFYSERFQKWCSGNTPFPIVNACMNQLNTTGYMSNRGRQLVASCFVHELGLDWRYGAAYFEHQLIDYDVSSNWGNWQYLAGVGADPRGHRRFNLEKQTARYDPEGEFIKRWGGNIKTQPIDSVDAADWPITNEKL
jgi:deoxyribodipyrimidine photo-lyase